MLTDTRRRRSEIKATEKRCPALTMLNSNPGQRNSFAKNSQTLNKRRQALALLKIKLLTKPVPHDTQAIL